MLHVAAREAQTAGALADLNLRWMQSRTFLPMPPVNDKTASPLGENVIEILAAPLGPQSA